MAAVGQQQNKLTYKSGHPFKTQLCGSNVPLTANSRHFLRVNAQTLYLDKQKTPQICKTLCAILTRQNLNLILEHKIKLKKLILDKTGLDISEPCNKEHFFTKEFERVFEQNDSQHYKDRLLYFHYFIHQFEKIIIHNKKHFNDYIDKLTTDGAYCSGEKFEILTYAKLLDKSISFSKPKSNPDFEFKFIGNSAFIECGTRQTNAKGYFIESVEQAIVKKQQKGIEQNYANKDTALHIEISKTVYNSIGEKDFLDKPILEKILDKAINEVSYGAIVIISTFYAKEDGIVYGHPVIKYNTSYNPNLEVLHTTLFNLQSLNVSRIYKPFI